jgi:hypothetical protein
MRMPKYLSPTSLKIWKEKRDDFYLFYLADNKAQRPPQTQPMSVGSAFDAYVKSFLVEKLLGKRPEFEFDTIFTQQVEPHNRDWALEAGKVCFDAYQKQGALSDILYDMVGCIGEPRFETKLEGFVTSVSVSKEGIPLLGKPDIFFIHKGGARVIFDWKVNGYCGANATSPKPGYIRERTNDPRTTGKSHAKAIGTMHQGVKISMYHPLCAVDKEWAAQLSIYAWLLGEDIGSDFVVAIDQLACGPDGFGGKAIRVAQHRSVVTPAFQKEVFTDAAKAWEQIKSGHIYEWMTRADSDAQCAMLESMAAAPADPLFDEMFR